MAISAVLLFKSNGDVRKIYDAVIDEMGVRDKSPQGAIYHVCAPVEGGLRVFDVWESRNDFDRFAKDKITPLTAKHGLQAPQLEIQDVHEMVPGRLTSHKGTCMIAEFEGDSGQLLSLIDQANKRMSINANPPEGLIFHYATATPKGARVIDHWRSREDFENFVDDQLADTIAALHLPQPHITYLDVYNTIDRRVPTRA
jgi:hypothetical protein